MNTNDPGTNKQQIYNQHNTTVIINTIHIYMIVLYTISNYYYISILLHILQPYTIH